MPSNATPTFGKRNARSQSRGAPSHGFQPVVTKTGVAPELVFAEARRELAKAEPQDNLEVPRSLRAAMLAGLIVGCCLAGLDIAHGPAALAELEPILAASGHAELVSNPGQALPWMIGFSLLSGARIAATTLLLAHRFLRGAGQTSHVAYALGGGALTAVYAALLLGLVHHQPPHGWLVDIAAGAGAGFFYRLFAGARQA